MPQLLSENKYFLFAIFLLIISLPLAIYWYKIKQKKLSLDHAAEMQNTIRQLDMAKVKSLSNFFNPHFINNALHWVQSKYRKDPETATVIGRLADNIQRIFDNTEKGKFVHLLQNEMEMVLNYLVISKARFGQKLNYSLPDAMQMNQLSQPYYLPTLLVQIHVENAVEKGIANLKDEGILTIDLDEKNDGLCIIISDNGNGRIILPTEVAIIRQSSTQVMEEMIELLNQYNKSKLLIEYDDFYLSADSTHASNYGTRVKLFIPKDFKYEL
jgi:two-component system sensor histidine kinase YesM